MDYEIQLKKPELWNQANLASLILAFSCWAYDFG